MVYTYILNKENKMFCLKFRAHFNHEMGAFQEQTDIFCTEMPQAKV